MEQINLNTLLQLIGLKEYENAVLREQIRKLTAELQEMRSIKSDPKPKEANHV